MGKSIRQIWVNRRQRCYFLVQSMFHNIKNNKLYIIVYIKVVIFFILLCFDTFWSKAFLARLYESTERVIAITPASASASASALALVLVLLKC